MMTAAELIEVLQQYPPDVQVIILVNDDMGQFAYRCEKPINNVYPYAYDNARAIAICYEHEQEDEE